MSTQTYSDFVREWFQKFKEDNIAYPPTGDIKKIAEFLRAVSALRTGITVKCWTEGIGSNGIVYVYYARCEGYRGDRLLFTTAAIMTSGDIGVIAVERRRKKAVNAPPSFVDLYYALFMPSGKKSEATYRLLMVEDGVAVFKLESYRAVDYDGKTYTKPSCGFRTAYVIVAPYATYIVRKYCCLGCYIKISRAWGKLNEIAHLLLMPKFKRA